MYDHSYTSADRCQAQRRRCSARVMSLSFSACLEHTCDEYANYNVSCYPCASLLHTVLPRMVYSCVCVRLEKSSCRISVSMDVFVLKALVDELRQRLCGAVVSKVFQMSPEDLLLRLWRHEDLRLLLSVQASAPRLHLTTARFRNPPQPPRFAALLRAHLAQVRL